MVEVLIFAGGIISGFIISLLSFKSGSKNAHQAYDIIYTTPTPQEVDGEEPQLTQEELYDWDNYSVRMKYQEFEKDEDNLDEKPN